MRGTLFKKASFSLLCATLMSLPYLVFSQETESNAPAAAPQGYFIDNTKPANERTVEAAVSTNQSYSTVYKETAEQSEESTVTDAAEQPPVADEEQAPTEEPQDTEENADQPEEVETESDSRYTEPVRTPEPTAPVPQKQTAIAPQPKKEVASPMRTFTKKIFVNKEAVHTCVADVFTVDMSERSTAQNTLTLTKEADIAYELEVGSLPAGIDVRFSDNNGYHKHVGLEDSVVDFTITTERNAATGSFTIPIIYTQKGVFDSSVVCQVNIVNA